MRSAKRTALAAILGPVLVTLLAAGCLSGCATTRPGSGPDPRLEGTWHLAMGTQHGSTIASGAEEITFTIGNAAHTGGSSPCSSYHASITGGLGAIFISAAALGSNPDCANQRLVHIDDEYLKALGATTVASIDDGVLVLSSPHSTLAFIKPTVSSSGTLQNTRWALVLPPDLRAPTSVELTFGRANQFTVRTSCSQTIARFLLVEDIILLRAVQTTPTAGTTCTPADLRIEAALTGQLTADVSARTALGPATLILTNRGTEEPLLWRAS